MSAAVDAVDRRVAEQEAHDVHDVHDVPHAREPSRGRPCAAVLQHLGGLGRPERVVADEFESHETQRGLDVVLGHGVPVARDTGEHPMIDALDTGQGGSEPDTGRTPDHDHTAHGSSSGA
ncbi:hypothetical protein [Streptomyces sp. NPDC017991]|uniref:hypothetical protein n=1 Tax=Streptomyces sp. NPDC017991 TaxID=3365026 RepID=UPI0037A3A7EB